ncbi:MAG: response regulator transcription factor [Firmicutes bacterium]|nr:response regulator transcription factor [Bacillota bacterium]
MISILILEDEEYTKRFIKKIVSESPLIKKVYETSSGNDAINYANEYRPDVALLDIELDENENLNGLEVAKLIKNVSPKTKFVFLTGYSKYALESFEVHPYDYILKPINIGKLRETLSNLAKNITGKCNKDDIKLIIKTGKEIYFIAYEDIIFIEKNDKKILVHEKSNQYETRGTLKQLEKELDENFIRVHKSFIVNKNRIKNIKELVSRSYEIRFHGISKKALMSRNRFEEIKNEIIS